MIKDVKIGELFGANIVVSAYVPHKNIMISPSEEQLFLKLMEMQKRMEMQDAHKRQAQEHSGIKT